MSTNYGLFQSQLFNQVAAVSSDPSWITELPHVIDGAEQRIYRDLDMIGTRVTDASASLTPNNRFFSLPTSLGTFIIVELVSALTPAGVSSSGATRNQVVPHSPSYIDLVWPSNSTNTGLPQNFCMADDKTLKLGPVPDQTYGMEVYGIQRPTPLSSGNSSTILTRLLPDLFFASAMIEAGKMMRYTEPTIGVSWTDTYAKLLPAALNEELRKKFWAEGWTDKQPSPIATPPRV